MIKKKWKIIAALFAIKLILVIIFFWQRNNILEPFVHEKVKRYEQEKSIGISYDRVCFSGIKNLKVINLSVIPENNDTLVYVKEIEAKLSLWKLLLHQKVELKSLKITGFSLSLKNDNGKRNFDFLLRKEKESSDSVQVVSNYTQKASNLLSLVFQSIPENILISEMNVHARSADFFAHINIPELKIKDHRFHSQIFVNEKGKKQSFALEGSLFHNDKKLTCKVYPLEKEFVEIPYLQHKYHAKLAFDTLQFQFFPVRDEKDLLRIRGDISFCNLYIQNERLSTEEISFQNSKIDYVVNIRPDHLELGNATTIQFNRLNFHPYIRIRTKPEIDLTVSIRKEKFPADDLFSSLPKGLFRNLEGIKTSGKLSYNFYFSVNMANVDSLKFESSMGKENFSIQQFGRTDFTRIRESFLYPAFENGKLVKAFEVGDSYPDFRSLEAISPYLRSAVLFSEDGFFFGHKGFVDDALQSSLVMNIKEKRFARGGSTISMQLVKNLYLSRDKTITRKLEEALIVWLIENNRLVSKNRMFEVYLNIIEWGPGIYGANEAARFYFNKDVANLTPEEAIFMASIVSRPKKFMWFFDENRELKPFLARFYEVVGGRMLKHGYITEGQFENLVPNVRITGEAVGYLKRNSVGIEEAEEDWEY
jgi:hypothetical protein